MFRAFASNSFGIGYGENKTLTTTTGTSVPGLPVLTTSAATYQAAAGTITTGGNISADGGSAITARGVCYGTAAMPTLADNFTTNGTGTGNFSSTITGVAANQTYYIRAYANNAAGTQYGNQQIVTTTTTGGSFTVGQSFGGGIIFYVDGSGQHGLIAATNDIGGSNGAIWDYRNNSTFLNATSNTDGKANTDKIIAALGTSQNYAALLCRNYNGGGFTDWFLPSRNQLNQLFQQRSVIGNFDTSDGYYWSSTEEDDDKAWEQQFRSGSNSGRQDDENKDKNRLIRLIRAF